MLDIQLLRKDLPAVVAGLARRGVAFDEAAFRSLEDERKSLQTRTEELQAKRAGRLRRCCIPVPWNPSPRTLCPCSSRWI